MSYRPEPIAATLSHLIQTCKNGQKVFCTAVEGVTDGNLRDLFNAYATQRARFAVELQSERRRLGAHDAGAEDNQGRGARRPWVRIRSALGGEDEGGLLSECGRGECATLESYREALALRLPESVYALVRRQYLEVQDAHNRLQAFEKLD